MWAGKKGQPMVWLMMFLGAVLGFCLGYRVLPQTRLVGAALPLLAVSLPFAPSPAEQTPPQAAQLLLGASLPQRESYRSAAAFPELSADPSAPELSADPSAGPEVAGLLASEIMLPAKAEPRLILMGEESIQVYAAQSLAAMDKSQPRIAVYCTHSSEEYRGEKRVAGGRGGVHQVAKQLADSLNELGLPTVYCDTVHDYPDWDLSYASSLASIQALHEQYPSIEMFIDIHRDSTANSVLATGSGNLARMMLVVGSNERLPHPRWQENLAFAKELQQALEARLPGIMRETKVQAGRYNQQLTPKSILVEMGSTVNSSAEACASARLLAAAIGDLLL